MPVVTKDIVPGLVATGASARLAEEVAPRFKVGDRVHARNINPANHTRLPRYVRGKVGTIETDNGVFIFPDTAAHGRGETPQHVYCVSFSAQDLWGPAASPKDKLNISMWDDYLDLA